MTAPKALVHGDSENEYVYRSWKTQCGSCRDAGGTRSCFGVPGFLLTTLTDQMWDVVDRANRSNNTLEVRGLFEPDLAGDITRANPSGDDSHGDVQTGEEVAGRHLPTADAKWTDSKTEF
jgi:hypothetical protein